MDKHYITENYTINTEEQNSYDENEENFKLIKEKYNRYKEDSEEQIK